MLSRTRLHSLKETQKQSRQHYKDPLQKHEKTQSASFFRLLFSKHIMIFMKTCFFIIRKLNAAANMFAST